LPLGTANNIANSLGIQGHLEEIIKNIDKKRIKKFDAGKVEGLKKELIFLESFGYGIFPELMKRMREIPGTVDKTPEENLKTALELLHTIIENYPATPFTITIDGMKHTENYILVEIMNISSIGPNLNISPVSDPGDGEFEIILVPERQRDEFASYVSYKISGIEKTFIPVTMKGKNISISAGPGNLHIDDELISVKRAKKVSITPKAGMMEFFVQ
jgi:diacylglycerol kinase family enzyme